MINPPIPPLDRISTDPRLAEAKRLWQSDSHRAEALYRSILRDNPRQIEAHLGLGQLLRARGTLAAALPHLKTALDLAPSRRQHWLGYVDALEADGNLDLARQILDQGRARGLHGADIEALAERLAVAGEAVPPHHVGDPPTDTMRHAVAIFERGHYRTAEPIFRDLTERFPDHGFGWHGLGLVLKHLGRNVEALVPMQRTTELMPDDAEAHFNLGVALSDDGQRDKAEASYRRALALSPNYVEALANMALLRLDADDPNEAVENARRALRERPDYVPAHIILGNALLALGLSAEAIACQRKAVDLAPDNPDACFGLGAALASSNDLDGAITVWHQGLAMRPEDADAHFRYGLMLDAHGQLTQAEAAYRVSLRLAPHRTDIVLALASCLGRQQRPGDAESVLRPLIIRNPDLAEGHYALAVALIEQKRQTEAEQTLAQTIALLPDHTDAHIQMGMLLLSRGRLPEAERHLRIADRLRPDFAHIKRCLAKVLLISGHPTEAEALYRNVLNLAPADSDTLTELGASLHEQGRSTEAIVAVREAFALDEESAAARLAMTILTLPSFPESSAEAATAPAVFGKALEELANWLASNTPGRLQALGRIAGDRQPFYLAYRDGNHRALLSHYGDLLGAAAMAAYPTQPPSPPPRKRLRLGVVSHHLHLHSVWTVILRGVVEHLDRSRFELVLYHLGHHEDTETAFARERADHWRDSAGRNGFDGWLATLLDDQPDVLLYPEIGMDPLSMRLAACRLAPLQVAAWGHPISTGLPTIDLYLSGELLEAEDADDHYREKLIRLPGTGCYTSPLALFAAPLDAEDRDNLSARPGIRFVVPQLPFKFDPVFDELYPAIAAQVPDAVFVLVDHPRTQLPMARVVDRLRLAFAAVGLEAEKHLLVLPWQSRERFLTLLDTCDVFLDCPGFSGYTTAWQALQRGIPVITMKGAFLRQRLAAGLLERVGAAETVVGNFGDYVASAVRLANECRNPVLRETRRGFLASRAKEADGDVRVIRALEDVLAREWRLRIESMPSLSLPNA